jgi:hypothetical protein
LPGSPDRIVSPRLSGTLAWRPDSDSLALDSSTGIQDGSQECRGRAAHWSAEHRKTAIFGWLAFVFVAVMLGNSVGQNQIHGADQSSGEAGRAEHALEGAGLRPNNEAVLTQSPKQREPSRVRRS